MKRVVFVLVSLTFLSLFGCLQMIDGANKALKEVNENSADKSESLSVNSYQTINIDSLYSLSLPDYMKFYENLHPEASLKYANIYKEAYTIVIHENKEEFIDTFKAFDEYDIDLSPVENYALVQKRSFKETLTDFKYQDYGLIEINGQPARQIKMFGTVDGLNASYVVAFVEGKDNMYMILNWTVGRRYENLENTFEYINGTFELL
ncbi:hypothetical protein [Winogradskyella sp.]|uniref:hypothetical protein n=1 Tax=Winogradskyella sp. TaxID=1883156 RepID=UPI00351814DC